MGVITNKDFVIMSLWVIISWRTITCKVPESKNLKNAVKRHIRSIEFPNSSNMGLFFAIAIPLDLPDKSISLSWYFEANYGLPGFNASYPANDTYAWDNNLQKRSIDRRLLYDVIQSKIESYGYPGKACLLRTICESAKFPFDHNGLIGDIFRIVFTPSSSLREALHSDILIAEYESDCSAFEKKCPFSFLDLITYNSE